MTQPDHITRDIAAKCGDDVTDAIKRSIALVETGEAKVAVTLSAAANALGIAGGAYLGLHDAKGEEPLYPAAAADGLWRHLKPMVIGFITAIRERQRKGNGSRTILPNPFAPVHVIPADREALYGGLISAGHPAEYARHMAYDMPVDDGSLQMLARHRLAYSAIEVRQDYEPAWRELHDALSWMQGNRALTAYLGQNFAAIANDLIDRAYPGLRAGNPVFPVGAGFLSMDQWDDRNEAVLLLVDYREDGDHALDDAWIAITIGHNNDHNVGEGAGEGWQFAGWCWTHDHYVQGKGKPIGWMPLPHHLAAEKMESRP